MSSAVRTVLPLPSVGGASKPTCKASVAVGMAAAQDIWLVQRFDAHFAQHKISHILNMFLKCR